MNDRPPVEKRGAKEQQVLEIMRDAPPRRSVVEDGKVLDRNRDDEGGYSNQRRREQVAKACQETVRSE